MKNIYLISKCPEDYFIYIGIFESPEKFVEIFPKEKIDKYKNGVLLNSLITKDGKIKLFFEYNKNNKLRTVDYEFSYKKLKVNKLFSNFYL